MALTIRHGQPADLNRLVEIYNYYVVQTHVTFDTEPFAVGERTQWFNQFSDDGPYCLLVAELDGKVIGYACSTPFKPKGGYRTSVETSVYLDPDHKGQGAGLMVYSVLLEQLAEDPSVHRAYGGVALPNPESIALHEKLGFEHVASYHEVGTKFDKYWDVDWYEKDLS